MAAGPLLAPAVEEVAALPGDSYVRSVAEPVLLHFRHVLVQQPSRTPDEQEFIVAMYKTWDEHRAEGRAEGRTETQANAVLTVLRVRRIDVPDAARQRILAEKDLQRLEHWLERAAVATSIGEVIDDPS